MRRRRRRGRACGPSWNRTAARKDWRRASSSSTRAYIQASSRAGRLRRTLVPGRPPAARSGARSDAAHLPGFPLRPHGHDGGHAAARGARNPPRRLPGLRPSADRLPAIARAWPPATSAATCSPYPPPGQQRLVGADASHAWLSVYCPGLGWIDLDPTNDLIPSDGHILLAWGRDYDDVSPDQGRDPRRRPALGQRRRGRRPPGRGHALNWHFICISWTVRQGEAG